jgi:hypothetical protein
VRNSSLVERLWAENERGSSAQPKLRIARSRWLLAVVGERSDWVKGYGNEAWTVQK